MALMIVSWIIDFEQSAKMTSAVDEVKVKFDKADATIRVYYRGGHYVTDFAQTLEFECLNGQS